LAKDMNMWNSKYFGTRSPTSCFASPYCKLFHDCLGSPRVNHVQVGSDIGVSIFCYVLSMKIFAVLGFI